VCQKECVKDAPNELGKAKVLYGLLATGLVIPIVAIAGLFAAYMFQKENPLLDAHLRYIIRTFWVGAGLFGLVALNVLGHGRFYVASAAMIWILARILTGFIAACGQRHPAETGVFALSWH
jgi:Predicted membrane protein